MLTLVTGGAGFLGSHLVDSLVRSGDEVVVLDNLATGSLLNLEEVLRKRFAKFIYVDVSRPIDDYRSALEKATRGKRIERIFHFASRSSVECVADLSWENLRVDGLATLGLIDLALEQKAHFVYGSTSKVFSNVAQVKRLHYRSSLDDSAQWHYEPKRFGETAVALAVLHRGLDGTVVRFPDLYGPRMPQSRYVEIAAFVEALARQNAVPRYEDRHQLTSMTFVIDAVRLLLQIISESQLRFVPIDIADIGDGAVIEACAAYEHISEVEHWVEHPRPRKEGALNRFERTPLGSLRATTLYDGLTETLRWRREIALCATEPDLHWSVV